MCFYFVTNLFERKFLKREMINRNCMNIFENIKSIIDFLLPVTYLRKIARKHLTVDRSNGIANNAAI